MIGSTRRSLMLVAAAAACTLAGCGGASSGGSPTGTPTAGQSAASSATPAGTFDETVTLSVTGRKVTPAPGRVKVSRGDRVQIVVTSDVANTVHVHGVDIEKDVPAGKPTALVVTMDQSGIFEVEMHDPALLLFQFEVR